MLPRSLIRLPWHERLSDGCTGNPSSSNGLVHGCFLVSWIPTYQEERRKKMDRVLSHIGSEEASTCIGGKDGRSRPVQVGATLDWQRQAGARGKKKNRGEAEGQVPPSTQSSKRNACLRLWLFLSLIAARLA